MDLYPRQQVLVLTGLTSGQLSRLDTSGMVKPQKLGSDNHRPIVLYSREQVWELRVVKKLRLHLTKEELSLALQSFRTGRFQDVLFERYLVFALGDLYFLPAQYMGQEIVESLRKNGGVAALKIVEPVGVDLLNL